MARVLIVEAENFFANSLGQILDGDGHAFVRVVNASEARSTLEREDFDVIVADIKNLGFADWMSANKSTPLIALTPFADGSSEKKIPLARCHLVKPFHAAQVRVALTAGIPSTHAGRTFESHQALLAMPERSARDGSFAEFNIYHYRDGRPEKLADRGEILDLNSRSLNLNIRLYTDRESMAQLLSRSLLSAGAKVENPKMGREQKIKALQEILKLLAEQAAVLNVDSLQLQQAISTMTTYFTALDDAAVWDLLTNLEGSNRSTYAQSLAVSLVCLALAEEMFYSTEDRFKLLTVALFHDIGKMALEPRLLDTPRVMLSMKDRLAIEKHVDLGAAILQKSSAIDPEVCKIVWQHHESVTGRGYPRGLKQGKIHPMARLVRVADEFCVAVMKSSGSPGTPPLRAVQILKANLDLDQEYVIALARRLETGRPKVTVKR